jgi:hypothetical protein
MRRIGFLSAVFLAAAACGGAGSEIGRSKPVVPLEATLLPPTHGIGFYINKSAHVAVFDIVPGAGIGLVYPRMGRELEYAARPGPQWIASGVPYWPASYVLPANSSVRYLFLVASREPLLIDDYIGYSDYLRQKLTNVVYTGNAYTAMEALIAEVVPSQPAEDWTTALYIVYGSVRGNRRPPVIYQLVKCTDGKIYWVQLGSSFVCNDPGLKADTLKEGEPEQPQKDGKKWKGMKNVLAFDPVNGPGAEALLRRPVARIDRPPMAPEPRTPFSDIRQRDYSGRGREPALSGADPGNGAYVPATPTVTTPAQQPSNPRGRVEDTGGEKSTGGAGTP